MLASFLSITQNLGYPALFGVVCAEALGVPLPGETALVTPGSWPASIASRSCS